MTHAVFRYLEKPPSSLLLDEIFDILATNMRQIIPTELTYEEEKARWMACVPPALTKEARQILLIYAEEELAGFFQYYVTPEHSVFMMEEIQLKPAFHGSGLFGELYRFLIPRLPPDIPAVEAYAHKRNAKSLSILHHMGLATVGEAEDPEILHLRGDYTRLKQAYGGS